MTGLLDDPSNGRLGWRSRILVGAILVAVLAAIVVGSIR